MINYPLNYHFHAHMFVEKQGSVEFLATRITRATQVTVQTILKMLTYIKSIL